MSKQRTKKKKKEKELVSWLRKVNKNSVDTKVRYITPKTQTENED